MFAKKKKNTKKTKAFNHLKNLDPGCAGIDIGADSVFVCALNSEGFQEVREYLTFTQDLKNMAAWLEERGVRSIAMESTGVYWIPPFEILEESGFEVLLVNAYHLKCVPGRKTDIKDAQWIQQLHSNGLLRGSFRPIDEYVRLRGLVRQRAELFKEGARKIQHMLKALTEMNVQLRMAVSDITGKTGLNIINAIINGERNPTTLALHRDRRCKMPEKDIIKALEGNWREEQLFILRQSYEAYEFFHKQIEECERQIQKILETLPQAEANSEPHLGSHNPPKDPFEEFSPKKTIKKKVHKKKTSYNRSAYCFDLLSSLNKIYGVNITEIPGFQENIAMVILSEIGTDMSRWRNKKAFASWLSLCPGNKISGGKILSGKTVKSDNRVAQALRLAANAVRNTDTAIGAYFRRMRSKFGPAKAITATAHKLAVILYTMLRYKKSYVELGAEYYENKYRERVLKNLHKKAKELGYEVIPVKQAV
ncbi:MAG: IS110 family transposase [Bacteroidia bacterium]